MIRRRTVAAAAALLAALSACRARTGGEGEDSAASPPAGTAVPVRVAEVRLAPMEETLRVPGHTTALSQLKVRAPFAGTLTRLTVADGDRVRRGQVIGTVVSRESEAALEGAESMLRDAQTPAQREDARRALALARGSLVSAPLRSATSGMVVAHSAAAGDRVAQDQDIVTVSDASSLVFQADVPQADLPRIRAGEAATIALPGGSTLAARVHGLLSGANAADLTAPVRLDLSGGGASLPVGLFGTAAITVARHPDARVVPLPALLRDDVTGVSRVAVVGAGSRARWTTVRPGLTGKESVEILSPELAPGTTVIVEGQVGLPDGAIVRIVP